MPASPSPCPVPDAAAGRPRGRRRRRQRSVRVTVAVALLSLATVGVLAAVAGQSPGWLTAAALVALVAGWAAARIVYTEVLQTRRDHARERAAQAASFRTLLCERADEHAALTTAMTDRLARRDGEVASLAAEVGTLERRAVLAETRVLREARLAKQAAAEVVELEQRVEELEILRAEEFDQLASWEGFETVVDLMAWERRVTAARPRPAVPTRRHA